MSPNELRMARDLFKIISEVVGKSSPITISVDSNFYDLGGNSMNSIYTVAKLRDRGYFIETTDFISAANLRDVLNHMKEVDEHSQKPITACDIKGKFIAELLQMEHKHDAIQ